MISNDYWIDPGSTNKESRKCLKCFPKWPLITLGALPSHPEDSQWSPTKVQQMSKACQNVADTCDMSEHMSKEGPTNQKIFEYLWIIYTYLWIIHGHLRSLLCVFSGCLRRFFPRKCDLIVLEFKHQKQNNHEHEKDARHKLRATHLITSPSNSVSDP